MSVGWGRYAGYFFNVYENKKKIACYGPFPSEGDANWWIKALNPGHQAGRIFQKEKPVYRR